MGLSIRYCTIVLNRSGHDQYPMFSTCVTIRLGQKPKRSMKLVYSFLIRLQESLSGILIGEMVPGPATIFRVRGVCQFPILR